MSKILSEKFLSKYREVEKTPLSNIGEFVYLRTYSRYLNDKKRRENWFETVLRTTEYNIELGIEFKKKHGLDINLQNETKEAELLFDNLYNLRTFTSGRTLYMGGTDIVKEYPLSNYNCSFTMIEKFHDFVDVFYLLMVGSGVGVRIDSDLISKMPKIRKIALLGQYTEDVHKYMPKEYMEDTKLIIDDKDSSVAAIKVGDSKEGWCAALETYFQLVTAPEYENIHKIIIDYSYVRPEGERLKRFGGRASGHNSLKRMFEKINKVCNKLTDGSLKSLDVLDIATIISENVVSGGVRRSAMMIICDEDDYDVINAKSNLYKIVDGNWIENSEVSHRKMSNNSVLYKEKPSLDKIKEILNSIKINGEPGFINGMEAKKRKSTFKGCNPCGEILLNSHQCCNLSTNNLVAFVNNDHELDIKHLEEIIKLSARVAIRMTLVNVELPDWDKIMQADRIVGISLTGMMDMINKTNMSYEELGKLLKHLREVVKNEGNRYCAELGISAPELMTTIKPEGSLSTLPCVSSGIHYSHSNYYIRRVRISVSDPLYKMIEKLKCYPIYNENGQSDENCTTKVIEFPIKAPDGKTKYDVGAIEQLELYKLSMINWTDHNTSITVHVRDDEWEAVANWLYENFDYVVGITFLPLMDETYPLLPYESTTKEDYEERVKNIKPIDYELLAELDDDEEHEIIDKECANGVCPVR
ncbi:ribonucleoside-triphosphate reductase, adenosylcobalamin-dependent [Clostridium sp. DL-VIII]|uniref:ribonucleoside-triphosphate reductase, adenosylcobalamin-dependent n=1 Tax=Clostridium sp. DL-VIII TaxID=641107 RepID=UPI00023AFAC9|nr:ribonucleoside-triphosphate reductase, adenosylcobalamin-dependent [Clostridium sp. DL-VIII]EHJ00670.1 ribonucleoside-triphosphate reductase, adenosylcobalamin-dependent [Clostridium sp. DL-VIII]